jgi:hypothetical protein
VTALIPLDGASPTALTLPPDLSYEEWRTTGHALGRLGKAVQWWLGDWLLHGESHFGEAFAQAATETGYSEESLRGFLWVSSRIPPSVRRSTLSWSHHQVVAGQDNAEELLLRAECQQLSVSRLREAVKGPPTPKPVCGMEGCPMRDH